MEAVSEEWNEASGTVTADDRSRLEEQLASIVRDYSGTLARITGLMARSVSDVRSNIQRFRRQLDAYVAQPSIAVGNNQYIPIDIVSVAISPMVTRITAENYAIHAAAAIKMAEEGGWRIQMRRNADARQDFVRGLTQFLIVRIEAARAANGGLAVGNGLIPAPGLNVTVATRSSGLKIVASPAYFLRLASGFGNSLSTPVHGMLGPGLYLFGGVAAGARGPVWELTPESIPPNYTVNLVNL